MPFKSTFPKDTALMLRVFKSYIDGLTRDYSLTFVERLVKYYKYHDQGIQFRGFEWQVPMINDLHPRQVAAKRSQVGVTTIYMWQTILFLEQYSLMPYYYISDEGVEMSLYPTAIYTLENDDKMREFSADRLRDFIRENPYLEDLLEEGDVDQISLKKFGRAGLYLGGRKTLSSVTTIPAQWLKGDEWDRTTDDTIGSQLESRIKASPMFRAKTQRGHFGIFSSPEMGNAGVTKIYNELSDQMVFMIRCNKCNEWQEMVFPESVANYYEKGQRSKGEVYYQCLKCFKPLDWSEIGKWRKEEPLKLHNCEWVPMRKEYYDTVTRYGEGYRGYRIPWAYSQPAPEVMRDRDTKDTAYFHHHVLGIPYEDKRMGLTAELFKILAKPDLKFINEPGYVHVMGADQGAYVSVWRLIPNSKNNLDPNDIGRWQLVHVEFSPEEMAFKNFLRGKNGLMIPKPGRLDEFMERFNIVLCVIDGEPDGNTALNFQKDWPKKVFVNHSTRVNFEDPYLGFNWVGKETTPDGEETYVCQISEDKTGALDAYFNFLYKNSLDVPMYEDEMGQWVTHHLNIKKTITEKQLSFGRKKHETIYYSVGMGDHFGQSGKFAFEAASLYHKVDWFNPSVIIASGAISGVKFKQEARR